MRIECQHKALQVPIACCLQTISHLTHLWIIGFYSAATFVELKSNRTDVGHTYSHPPMSHYIAETFSFTHWPVASDSWLPPLHPPTDQLFHWKFKLFKNFAECKNCYDPKWVLWLSYRAGPSRLISLRSMNNKIFVRMTRWGNRNVWKYATRLYTVSKRTKYGRRNKKRIELEPDSTARSLAHFLPRCRLVGVIVVVSSGGRGGDSSVSSASQCLI